MGESESELPLEDGIHKKNMSSPTEHPWKVLEYGQWILKDIYALYELSII